MNKKLLLILASLILCFSFICSEINMIGHSVYHQGDSFESGGKNIEVVKISQINAVISVDGVKGLISVGEHKIINNVNIKVVDLFYVNELEARNVDLSISVLDVGTCGDGKCKVGETSETCCVDCRCPINYKCENNECVYSKPPECRKHEDCDDENPETFDICVERSICKHYNLKELEQEKIEELKKEKEQEIEQKIVEEIKEKQSFFLKLINFLKLLFGF